jgi:hypothetical protein
MSILNETEPGMIGRLKLTEPENRKRKEDKNAENQVCTAICGALALKRMFT